MQSTFTNSIHEQGQHVNLIEMTVPQSYSWNPPVAEYAEGPIRWANTGLVVLPADMPREWLFIEAYDAVKAYDGLKENQRGFTIHGQEFALLMADGVDVHSFPDTVYYEGDDEYPAGAVLLTNAMDARVAAHNRIELARAGRDRS